MTRTSRRPLLRRPITWVVLAAGVVVAVAALALFQPWKLFVDQTVDEALPAVSAPAEPAAPGAPDGAGTSDGGTAGDAATAEPVVLASGDLITHEHETTGTVQVLELADGSRVLRVEDLETSNGPDLKVWITDAPVIPGRDGWGVFDDGRYVDLGALKGNVGSSNYVLPPEVDLTELDSVSIWCDRFNVSFGAAALQPVTT
ncbi:MAG TPA: DM13 domain-containing protein [Pseudonocardia sp.]|nr:DM13 domain-containing protein [Pseudonocardia sp.]